MIIELNNDNVDQYVEGIALVHMGAYHSDHLTANFSLQKLGEYYKDLVNASDLSIVALDDCMNVAGFIVAGENVGSGVSKFLNKNRLYVLSVLLLHPPLFFNKIKHLIARKFRKTTESSAKFRLLSIAVSANTQSKGVGGKMIEYFENVLRSRSIDKYGLSVKLSNSRAIKFYEDKKFIREKDYLGSAYYCKII